MPCFVPEPFRRFKEHLILSDWGDSPEVAEWVIEPDSLTEGGHWVRHWRNNPSRKFGDFPSLCQATYIRPLPSEEET